MAHLGSVLGLGVWAFAYMILSFLAFLAMQGAAIPAHGPTPFDRLSPFWWGIGPVLALAALAMALGEERMLDGVECLARRLGDAAGSDFHAADCSDCSRGSDCSGGSD